MDEDEFARLIVRSKYHLICGTSIGGIIAVMLALEVPLSRILRLFRENGGEIFTKEWFWKVGSSKYKKDGMLNITRMILREQGYEDPDSVTMDQIFLQLCVMTYDVDHSRVISISNVACQPDIDTRKVRVVDAVLSTAAAPTYFPMCSWKLTLKGVEQEFNCVDGCVWSNDPSLYSLVMRRFIDQDPNKVHNIICFGTGTYSKETHSSSEWYSTVGWLAGSPNLIDVILNASTSLIETMMTEFNELKISRYIKCQVALTQDIKLDNVKSIPTQEEEVNNMDMSNIEAAVSHTLYMGTNIRNIVNDKKREEHDYLPESFKEILDEECLKYLRNLTLQSVKYYLPDFPQSIVEKFLSGYSQSQIKLIEQPEE